LGKSPKYCRKNMVRVPLAEECCYVHTFKFQIIISFFSTKTCIF
jgi:hypothetical protein